MQCSTLWTSKVFLLKLNFFFLSVTSMTSWVIFTELKDRNYERSGVCTQQFSGEVFFRFFFSLLVGKTINFHKRNWQTKAKSEFSETSGVVVVVVVVVAVFEGWDGKSWFVMLRAINFLYKDTLIFFIIRIFYFSTQFLINFSIFKKFRTCLQLRQCQFSEYIKSRQFFLINVKNLNF